MDFKAIAEIENAITSSVRPSVHRVHGERNVWIVQRYFESKHKRIRVIVYDCLPRVAGPYIIRSNCFQVKVCLEEWFVKGIR